MNFASIKDLKRRLREMGYSDRAVKEIIGWYEQDNTKSKRN